MRTSKNYPTTNSKRISRKALSKLDKGAKIIFVVLIRGYQMMLSPLLGGRCRFEPTCSHYGAEAFRRHSFFTALYLTTKRILKCHPFGTYGFDPLPEKHHD